MRALIVVLAIAVTISEAAFADRLLRTFLSMAAEPLTMKDAIQQGWKQLRACDPKYGIPFGNGGDPGRNDPQILYFTASGHFAGFGPRVWGVPSAGLAAAFYNPVSGTNNQFDLILSTRPTSAMCDPNYQSTEIFGTQLTLGQQLNIPLDSASATQAGWQQGRCISKMGTHYSFDLQSKGTMTWISTNLAPVMPMYNPNTNKISAVLFNVPWGQLTFPIGEWEGPFPNSLMCLNWCDKLTPGCTFPGVSFWSTMHWMLTDPSQNSCDKAVCSLGF
jgi:hypothetical protein